MGEVTQVSVAEIAPRGEEFERTPPHDLAAEQCVLGGMLMSKDAISDVFEVIQPSDHYRPAHQIVHEVILDLYGRGEPADAVTVANELTKRGEIARVGSSSELKVDVRVISATNREVESLLQEGRFREDLYYRISTLSLRVPAGIQERSSRRGTQEGSPRHVR